MKNIVIVIVILVALSAGVYYFSLDKKMPAGNIEDEAMMEKKDDVMMKDEDAMTDDKGAMVKKEGSYETYSPEKLSLAADGRVVLFFHADWCPICRAIEAEIKANPTAITEGVHILKVDYDTATALRQKYGVTVQHTFVQVDSGGNLIQKWSDSSTLAGALGKIR